MSCGSEWEAENAYTAKDLSLEIARKSIELGRSIGKMEIKIENARMQGEWIPVSERLPEKNMACLVAVGKFNLTQIAVYSDLMGTIKRRVFYQGDYGHENFEDITQYVNAWMPLPEPYKEGAAE